MHDSSGGVHLCVLVDLVVLVLLLLANAVSPTQFDVNARPVAVPNAPTELDEALQFHPGGARWESVEDARTSRHPIPTPVPALPNTCEAEISTRSLISEQNAFRFSQSYQVDSESAIGSASLLLDTSESGGLYTRYAFNLRVSMGDNSTLSSSVNDTFTYVSADVGNNCLGAASRSEINQFLPSGCPPGSVCELITPTTISISLTNARAVYRLQRICMSAHGFSPASGASSIPSHCPMPFSYYPVDVFDAVDAACAALGAGVDDDCLGVFACLSATPPGCGQGVCDSSDVSLPDLSDDLDGNCGAMRDPDTGFDNNLNRACVSACCDPCTAQNYTDPQYHQRWAIGPKAYALQVIGVDRILADLEVNVTVQDSSTNSLETISVSLQDIDKGNIVLNSGPDEPYVRVVVNELFAQLFAVLPDLSGGAIVVWGDDDGLVFQSNDTRTNPWLSFPDEGENLTPTSTILGEGYGWAYVNKSTNYGPQPGAYGVSQLALVAGGRSRFGRSDTCYDGSYYEEHIDLPGWDINPNTADVPLIASPCQMSHALNSLSAQLVANTPQDLLSGQWFLPPNWVFTAPNYFLVGNELVYELRPGTPSEDQNVVPQSALRGLVQSFVRQEDLAVQYAEIYVDVSADFSKYTGQSNTVGFDKSSSGCLYSLMQEEGGASVVMVNAGTLSVLVQLQFSCKTSNATLAHITSTSNAVQEPNIPIGSSIKSSAMTFALASTVNATQPQVNPLVVSCIAQMVNPNNQSQVYAELPMICVNADDPFLLKQATVTNGTLILANNTVDGPAASPPPSGTSTSDWVLIALGVVTGVVLLVGIILGIVYGVRAHKRHKANSKKTQEAKEETLERQ